MSAVVGLEGDYSPGTVQPPHAPSEGVILAIVVVSRGGSTEHRRRQGRAILAPRVGLAETAPTKERRQGAEGATIFPISHDQFFHRQILQLPRRLHCSLSYRRAADRRWPIMLFSAIGSNKDSASSLLASARLVLLVLVIG
jgi:hypothetical protein